MSTWYNKSTYRNIKSRIFTAYYDWLDYLDDRGARVAVWAIVAIGAASLLYFAGNGIESLAPYGFAFGKLLAIVLAWEIFDRLRFRGINFIMEIERENIAAAVMALAIAILLHAVFGNI